MKVRRAVQPDIGAAALMMRGYYEELPDWLRSKDFDYAKLTAHLTYIVGSPDWGVFCAIDSMGVPVGYIAGVACPTQAWSSERHAVESCLYVHPASRGTPAAIKLIRAFEEWAKAAGCTSVALSVGSGLDVDRVTSLYERLGYRRYGIDTIKEI